MENTQDLTTISPELQTLINNKDSGYEYRQRRQDQWKENYTLYRDTVTYNRLTQRQSVNVPLMKQTIRTLLKDVDDMPVLYFENLDNDKQAELFQNEYWKLTLEENKMEIKDIVDKKQDMFFGRTFDQIQIINGKVVFSIIDPEDIVVDRYLDPTDIHSARFLIHTHIFVPLSTLETNPNYDKEKISELKLWHESDQGLVKNKDNKNSLENKNRRLSELGLDDVDNPVLGETIVELSMHFVYHKEEKDDEEQLYLYVEADQQVILMKKRLEDHIGVTKDHFWRNHFPYSSWADDIDMQDFWTDGIADIIRTPNKILNSWFSQLVENRTLRNFGMNYYNSNIEGFNPQTFTPVPWGWYPIPLPQNGNINEHIQRVEIPELSESLDEMRYIEEIAQKSTGATSTQQGVQTERKVTLGEVQLALGEAKERIKGMSKFYTQVWKDRALLFLKMIEAAPDKIDAVKIYKKGKNTNNIFEREISPKDFMTKSGYSVKIWSQDERNEQNTQKLEKINAAVMNMPGNLKLIEVYQRKLLEFADLQPDEINEIMQVEQMKQQALSSMNQTQIPPQPSPLLAQPPIPQAPVEAPKPEPKAKPKNTEVISRLKNVRKKLASNG